MKILLFGEYSGLHTNLQKGLSELGHDVVLLSFGDGFKNLNGDININRNFRNKYLNYLSFFFRLWFLIFRIKRFDIIQFIAYEVLVMPYLLKILYIKILKIRNKAVIVNRCGLDAYGMSVLLGNLRYSPFQNELKENIFDGSCSVLGYKNVKRSIRISNVFTGIIVNMYEYYLPYYNFKNFIGYAPLPLKVTADYKPNAISGKVKILYGILRRALKGDSYIQEALKILKDKYSDKVEILIVEKVPFSEYDKLLNNCNILIDQACSYSIGMNALYALSKGKVVLGGNEKEAEDFFRVKSPVVNILPSAEDIVGKLIHLIENPQRIEELSMESRVFAINHHDHQKVAMQYINIYSRL